MLGERASERAVRRRSKELLVVVRASEMTSPPRWVGGGSVNGAAVSLAVAPCASAAAEAAAPAAATPSSIQLVASAAPPGMAIAGRKRMRD